MANGLFNIQDVIDDNPFLEPDTYGPGSDSWIDLVDTYINGGPPPPGMTLAQIRALNSAIRSELRSGKQICNASGGLVIANGKGCLFGEAALDKANEILENPNSPQGIKDKAQRWLDANQTEDTGTGTGEDGLGELDQNTSKEDLRKILRDNGYSDEAIDIIFDAEVNSTTGSGLFQGNNVLSNALCEIGYSNCSDWSVTAVNPTGNECMNADGEGTYQNGKCVTDTSENSLCYNVENGVKVEGKRDANGQCISLGSGGGASDTNCVVITQENADECGYEITSDGQLVPKDLSGDPNKYPTYVNCGGGIFAETEEDCPEIEGTGGYSEEEQSTAQAIKDWIEGQIGKVKDMTVDDVLEVVFGGNAFDPKCELTGEGEEMWDCTGTDGTEGNQCWKDCVSVSVLGGIPGLPMPPGNIDVGTVRDLENTANEIGTTIGGILNPDPDDEGFIQKVKDWVIGKIEDIFGDIDDVTLKDITGWITGTLGNVLGGLILIETEDATNTVKEKIDDILFGVAPTGDDENCIEREYFEANKETCTALGYLDCDASVGEQGQELTGGIIGPDQTTEGCQEVQDPNCIGDGKWDGEKCVCPEGSDLEGQEEPLSGDCSDSEVQVECPEGTPKAGQMVDNLEDCGTTTVQVECPEGTPKAGQMVDNLEDCGTTTEKVKCPEGTPKAGQMVDNLEDCGTTTEKVKCPEGTPKAGQMVDNLEDCGTTGGCPSKGTVLESGCDGTTFFIRFADGECGEIYDSVPGYSGCGGGYECDDPNATVREDGSCGPCKAGYVFNGALERCVQESVTNPCNDATYAAANPQECGTGSECVDCSCAEYAAANPEECGTTPPPPPPSGGSGGTGGTGGGMFSVDAGFELQGDPQLLTKMQFPIENFLQQYVEGMGDQNTSITSLFEGLV
jgi:hypothetical protein